MPWRIGYWVGQRKAEQFESDVVPEAAKHGGVELVRLDLDAELEAQGPFDGLLLKLSDEMRLAESGSESSAGRVARVERYCDRCPDLVVVDHPRQASVATGRSRFYDQLRRLGLRLGPEALRFPDPVSVRVGPAEGEFDRDALCCVPFPALAKVDSPAKGLSGHLMAVLPCQSAAGQLRPGRWVLERYVNHGAEVYKVYVMGGVVHVHRRRSLPDLPTAGTAGAPGAGCRCDVPEQTDSAAPVFFDSQELASSDLGPEWDRVESSLSGWWAGKGGGGAAAVDSRGPSGVRLVRDSVCELAREMADRLGLGLFGFDLVVETGTGHPFLVDFNHFPSYRSLASAAPRLVAYLAAACASRAAFVRPPVPARGSGEVTIVGYGSLMSPWSARRTCPSLRNYRLARLCGFARVFSLVAVSMVVQGQTSDLKLAAVAAAPVADGDGVDSAGPMAEAAREGMLVCAFEIDTSDLPAYAAREGRYRLVDLPRPPREVRPLRDCCGREWPAAGAEDAAAAAAAGRTVICCEWNDKEYREKLGSDEAYHEQVGRHYGGRLWGRPDVLPCQPYLRFVLDACAQLGPDVLDNFLRTSFLADRRTRLSDYVQRPDSGANDDLYETFPCPCPCARSSASGIARQRLATGSVPP